MRGRVLPLLPLLLGLGAAPLPAQERCVVDRMVATGWTRYRAGGIEAADSLFAEALRRCPRDVGARVGRGYAALRSDRLLDADRWFQEVLTEDSSVVDALLGRGLVAWRRADGEAARDAFRRVLARDSTNETARDLLGRLAATTPPDPLRAVRPPLVLPDSLVVHARARREWFEVPGAGGWEPFYVKGVNLGAALPGRYPSEFPDSVVYAAWIADLAEMGANVVRVYTIHPPALYQALLAHNRAHPSRPLWIMHGVWTELPPDHDYEEPEWEAGFFAEMRRVVDVVHGRADLEPHPGHAAGAYTADVSPWVLGFLIGREWEPYSVVGYNRRRPEATTFAGRYLTVAGGTPMDAWLGKALEHMVAYETETYRTQRPMAYTNWPTLDPMQHPTEATAAEERTLRESEGEVIEQEILEYDNDAVGLDATLLRPTTAFPAGVFAAFHAYPYYPDFMVLDSVYAHARSSQGPSSYFGYLLDLRARHSGMPVVIAEYGVPASRGIAHVQPQGWHHGGHTESAQALINARLTQEIAEAGMAGGILFAWIDEWFKRNWIVIEFELPPDRNRLWLNRLDAEQMYGVVAVEPEPAVAGETLEHRRRAWRAVAPVAAEGGRRVRAAADAADLWLLIEPGTGTWDTLYVGFDLVDPDLGERRWPGRAGPPSPVGLEFVLALSRTDARLLVHPPYNPARIARVRAGVEGSPTAPAIATPPPGFFAGRFEQRSHRPVAPQPSTEGVYQPLRVVTNRLRLGRDRTEYAALGYDRGVLRLGPPPDGEYQIAADGVVEIRLPWLMLNVTDPSSRRVLHDLPTTRGPYGTSVIDGIGIVVAGRDSAGRWFTWPGDPGPGFSWATWEEPRWRARRRPAFEAMRRLWEGMEPARAAGSEPGARGDR